MSTNVVTSSVYLMKVVKKSKVSLELLHQFEHNEYSHSVQLGPRAIVIQNHPGDVVIAMDVHTRTKFLMPSFSDAMMEATGVNLFFFT